MVNNLTVITAFKGILPHITFQTINNESIITLSKHYLLFNFYILKNHISFQYKLLTCISGIDLIENKYRFCISYELLSLVYNLRLRLKVFLNEIAMVASLTSIFLNSNWWEREVWDLFGIYFVGHLDLRRILTDYGFEGYPLRKDFPLSGYIDLRYDLATKRLIAEPLELSQEFRIFTFEMPW